MSTASRPHLLGFWMCVALMVENSFGWGVHLLPASLAPCGLNSLLARRFAACGAILLAIIGAGAEAVPWDAVLLLLGVPLYYWVRKTSGTEKPIK